jgi:hypothetical protein
VKAALSKEYLTAHRIKHATMPVIKVSIKKILCPKHFLAIATLPLHWVQPLNFLLLLSENIIVWVQAAAGAGQVILLCLQKWQ